jgi:hypothetical protein
MGKTYGHLLKSLSVGGVIVRRFDLSVSRQNNLDVVKYVLNPGDVYDDRVAEKASEFSNISPFQYIDMDGRRCIISYMHEDTTLAALMKETLGKKEVLSVLDGVAAAFEIGAQGVPVSYIIRDANYVYVNRETLEVKCILLPVKQDAMPLSEMPVFFRDIISNMMFDENDTDNYVAKLLTSINSADFSIAKFKQQIDEQLDIEFDSGRDGAAEPKTNNHVKVSRLGVMNAMANRQMMEQQQLAGQMVAGQPMGMPPQPPMQQMPPQRPMAPQTPPQAMPPQAPPKPMPPQMPPQAMPPQAAPKPMPPQTPPQAMPPQPPVPPQAAPKPVAPQTPPQAIPPQQPVPPQAMPPQAPPKPMPPQPAEPSQQGSLMGQLGSVSKPVPHMIRRKTGEVIFINKPEFAIGKSKTKADYPLENNPAISRVHCIIVQKNGVNYIKDNHSTNHTFLNGVELEPGTEMLLKHKSVIQMGDEEFTFLLRKGD